MDYRSRVIVLFAATIPVLLISFVLSLTGLEPYPAVLMPQFGHAGDGSGEVQFEAPHITVYKNGKPSFGYSSKDLLPEVPSSFRSAILQNRFRYANGDERPVKRVEATLGGKRYVVKRTQKVWPERTELEFCRYQLELMDADSIHIRWIQESGKIGSLDATALPGKLIITAAGTHYHE